MSIPDEIHELISTYVPKYIYFLLDDNGIIGFNNCLKFDLDNYVYRGDQRVPSFQIMKRELSSRLLKDPNWLVIGSRPIFEGELADLRTFLANANC